MAEVPETSGHSPRLAAGDLILAAALPALAVAASEPGSSRGALLVSRFVTAATRIDSRLAPAAAALVRATVVGEAASEAQAVAETIVRGAGPLDSLNGLLAACVAAGFDSGPDARPMVAPVRIEMRRLSGDAPSGVRDGAPSRGLWISLGAALSLVLAIHLGLYLMQRTAWGAAESALAHAGIGEAPR